MAGFTEKEVYEAFGLGEQVQEVADPAAESDTPTGAQVQEIADPAESGDTTENGEAPTGEDREEPSTEGAEEAGPKGQPLTTEQRRQNAEARRQREKQAQQAATDQAVQTALQQEREKHAADIQVLFDKAGLKNTITGEPITNMEQLEAWQHQLKTDQLGRDLKAGKLTPEGLEVAIGEHPVVKQAQQMLSQNAESEKARRDAEARAQINAEIAEIGKLDASISTLEDLMGKPYWPELYAMTQRGYSIKDAHFLLNHKRLEEAKLEAARNAAANNARGKSHMNGLAPARGTGSITVPAAELAMYRAFNPGASDAEIQAHYNRLKNQ